MLRVQTDSGTFPHRLEGGLELEIECTFQIPIKNPNQEEEEFDNPQSPFRCWSFPTCVIITVVFRCCCWSSHEEYRFGNSNSAQELTIWKENKEVSESHFHLFKQDDTFFVLLGQFKWLRFIVTWPRGEVHLIFLLTLLPLISKVNLQNLQRFANIIEGTCVTCRFGRDVLLLTYYLSCFLVFLDCAYICCVYLSIKQGHH